MMSEFEFDDEIDVCSYEDFKSPYRVRFICDTDELTGSHPYHKYLVLTDDGQVLDYPYARKIEPMVWVWNGGKKYPVPQSLFDKIKAGEFE